MIRSSQNRSLFLQRLACSPFLFAAAALVLRLAILYIVWHHLPLAERVGAYGGETGSVANAIASGRGFSSPLPLLQTGPTAWVPPVYAYLLAAIFKTWGIYSANSHIVALLLNCVFASLTVLPIYAVARHSFGGRTAVISSWLWVLLPAAWHIPLSYVWDTALSALWFALLFWATLMMRDRAVSRERGGFIFWLGYGALWAAGAMINPTIVAVFPFLFLWLVWKSPRGLRGLLSTPIAAIVVFALGMAPWTIRNYRAFHKFIPLRSCLGIQLWQSYNPVSLGVNHFFMLPTFDLTEAREFQRLGEIDYSEIKAREAVAFIRAHPAFTLRLIGQRVASFWFDVTDRSNEVWSADPPYVKILTIFNAFMVLAAWCGVIMAWRSRNSGAAAYAVVLLAFPVIYYVTFPMVRYRFPIEPLVVIVAVYGASQLLARAFRRQSWLRSRIPWLRTLSMESDG